jgi:hypothetical protein
MHRFRQIASFRQIALFAVYLVVGLLLSVWLSSFVLWLLS